MREAIILLLICVSQGFSRCPTKCICNSRSVSCVNEELETIPNLRLLDMSPVILDFSGNNFLFISEENLKFPDSEEVQEIYLNNSGIAEISSATFYDFENLQELYLGHNYLSSIPESIIEGLDSMVLLDISSNYFNGDMPVIRSKSLEVLLITDSKISNIPQKAFRHMPSLKILMLQQNNIQTLAIDIFDKFLSNSFFVNLSFNSWTCKCHNLKVFEYLENRDLIDSSDLYQCRFEDGVLIDIFGKDGAIAEMLEQCRNAETDNELQMDFGAHQEVRDMIEEKNEVGNLNKIESTIILDGENVDSDGNSGMKDTPKDSFETGSSAGCWQRLRSTNENYFVVILTVAGFCLLTGFISGLIFMKILNIIRYHKLDNGSYSQVQLLKS